MFEVVATRHTAQLLDTYLCADGRTALTQPHRADPMRDARPRPPSDRPKQRPSRRPNPPESLEFPFFTPSSNSPKQSFAFFSTIRRSKNALEARFRAPNSLIY
jgi:hypothetical protein